MLRIVAILACLTGVAAADPIHAHGHIVDKATHEPLVGATLILQVSGHETEAQITDETGAFTFEAPAGDVRVTIYYLEASVERTFSLGPCEPEIDLGTIEISVPIVDVCCFCDFGPPPMIDMDTALASVAIRTGALRTRDSTALLPFVASAPRRPTTWLDGNRRLGPGVALALLDQIDVYTTRGATDLEQASDGVLLATKTGSNENRGGARMALDQDGAALEAGVGGPIAVDSAWWWAGAVVGPAGQQELAKVNVAVTPEEQGNAVALHQIEPVAPPPGAIALATQLSDDWGSLRWESKFDDNKLQITGGASGERLDEGVVTTRGAVNARLVQRAKVFGYHSLRAYAELGMGRAGLVQHRDATASAGDSWEPLPNITIDAGVRWDERRFGDARAEVWQPHVTIGYDWTREARAQAFVSSDRASLLDAGPLGAWRTAPRFRDDLLAGVSYEVADSWLATVAVRDRDGHTGVDGQLDHRGHLELRVTASSIERAVAGYAAFRHDSLRLGLDGRWAPAGDVYGSQAGALASWHHDMKNAMATDLGAELVADRLGKLARVVVGFSY